MEDSESTSEFRDPFLILFLMKSKQEKSEADVCIDDSDNHDNDINMVKVAVSIYIDMLFSQLSNELLCGSSLFSFLPSFPL